MNLPPFVQIPYSTYQNLLEHLQIHAPTDGWAATLLQRLQEEAQVISNQLPVTANGKEVTNVNSEFGIRNSELKISSSVLTPLTSHYPKPLGRW